MVRVPGGSGLLFVMLCTSFGVAAAPVNDGGGRDVSVALFSTRSLHAVTVTPIGATWIAQCARCAHRPLASAIHISRATEIFAGGALRVSDDASRESRAGTGLWNLKAIGRGNEIEIDVVLTLPSERYVAAVLNAEAASSEPAESLRALAILARTYALNGKHFIARPNHLAAGLCDSTECEAMLLAPVSSAIADAVLTTAGETLWSGSQRAQVFFSQSCGGMTEDAGAAWPRLRGVPYLRSHADPYCVRRNAAQWHAEVPLSKLAEISSAEAWHVPVNVVASHAIERSVSHRVLRVGFTGVDGKISSVSASALRFGIGRTLGWNYVRSDAYEIGVRNGALVFDGRGHGHGVGLCQEGSAEMASEGRNAREILKFYFPGTTIRILPDDEGWQETRAGELTLRSTHPLTEERKMALKHLWSEAKMRFTPRRAVMPEITLAPTTEVFRQLTAQPGWELASTRGSTIVLQPDAVLHANGRDASATMLHEMLHVLVEDQASERAPIWLREGLVEALADESDGKISAKVMSLNAIDSALTHADSLQESRLAHIAAAARVRTLIKRYGLSAVRGWLVSGVPAGAE